MVDTPNQPEPGKPTRADEMRTERRYKPGDVVNEGKRLTVDVSALDRENYEYRWGNDDAYRIQSLMRKDWDPAPEAAAINGNGMGTVNTHLAGRTEDGKPFNAVLMRKRKDWYKDDQARKMAPLEEQDKKLREGHGASAGKEADLREGVYTPGGRNIIERA